jgi:uncharacterized membrane protein YjgN (DUF898 family)
MSVVPGSEEKIRPGADDSGAAVEAVAIQPAGAAEPLPPAPPPRSRVQFSGTGREYFSIWVVNLLLTLLTFGAYSAWAKVRKTRYFYQNTRLDGHAFDYHGAPLAILRGRMLAVVLLVAYTWSFDISRTVGLTTIAVLCLAGPWLFMKAQQFKFRNSSWRGLRFGFDSNLAAAYRKLLPLLLIWFSGTIIGALVAEGRTLNVVGSATGLLLPLMHHTLKRYQHSRISYGDVGATFKPALGRFYLTYFKGSLLLMVSAAVGVFVVMGVTWAINAMRASTGVELQDEGNIAAMFAAGAIGLLAYLGVWPYLSVRLQQIVWGNSHLGSVGFQTHVRAWPLLRLVFKCVALTLITLGLYWPFAAVALARYRIENMEVIAPAVLGETVAGINAKTVAAGEGAADLFGLDVGL